MVPANRIRREAYAGIQRSRRGCRPARIPASRGSRVSALTLQPVGPEAAALVREIMLRCWTGTVAGNSSAYRETDADIAAHLSKGHGILAYLDGQLVGGGRFSSVPGPAGE